MRTLIKNGVVVTASDQWVGDVLIDDDTIALLGRTIDVQVDRVGRAGAGSFIKRAGRSQMRAAHHT